MRSLWQILLPAEFSSGEAGPWGASAPTAAGRCVVVAHARRRLLNVQREACPGWERRRQALWNGWIWRRDCRPGSGHARSTQILDTVGRARTDGTHGISTGPRSDTLHILFVCTGNICRSPTAERLAIAYCTRQQIPDFTASSAGTRAMVAHPVHQDAAQVLESLGGDASDFAARRLTPKMAAAADLVLTMTRAHRDSVLELAPHKLNRTFTLIEAARLTSKFDVQRIDNLANFRSQLAAHEIPDIPDPMGQSADVFAAVGNQIAELLPPVLELCRS